VLAGNPGTLPLTARFKKFFAQRTLAESTRISIAITNDSWFQGSENRR
jgi:hypothetical protein